MEKLFKISVKTALVIVLFLSGSMISKAQTPYKMSIGGVVGNMEGASFKLFFADKVAFQADLGVKFVATQFGMESNSNFQTSFGTLEVNPNVVFENNIKISGIGQWLWFVGIGASIGYQFENNGKFGANVIVGFEYSWTKTPISIQIDYRPGYGMLFNRHATQSYFDWELALSLRYNL